MGTPRIVSPLGGIHEVCVEVDQDAELETGDQPDSESKVEPSSAGEEDPESNSPPSDLVGESPEPVVAEVIEEEASGPEIAGSEPADSFVSNESRQEDDNTTDNPTSFQS